MPPNVMSESLALADACFNLARVLKWSKDNPSAEAAIGVLAENLNSIAMKRVHDRDTLGIDVPVVARAVAYLTQTHAIPPMGDETEWFGYMLDAVLEVARPNSGLDGDAREFLQDLLEGIAAAKTI
jgi:hypothetical protein